MHVFAIATLFALGIMAFSRWLDQLVPVARNYSMITVVVLGVLGAWLADFDLWEQWGVSVREEWIGVVLTGVALGGLAYAWQVVLGLFTGVARKTNDEAEALEKTQGLRAA